MLFYSSMVHPIHLPVKLVHLVHNVHIGKTIRMDLGRHPGHPQDPAGVWHVPAVKVTRKGVKLTLSP